MRLRCGFALKTMTEQHSEPNDPSGAAETRWSLTARMAASSAAQAGGQGIALVVSFATFILVTRSLGPEAYGDYTAALSFLFIPVVLADVGLSSAVLREISGSPDRAARVLRASIPLRMVVSALAIGGATAIGLALPFNSQTKTAILITAVASFFTLMNLSLLPHFQARLKMHQAVVANVAGRIVTLGLTLGALAADLGFEGVVWALAIGPVVTFAVNLGVLGRTYSFRPDFDVPYWRALLRGSIVIGLAMGVNQVLFRVDAVLLAFFRDATEVGYYGAAVKLVELTEVVAEAISITFMPALRRFATEGDERLQGLARRGFDVLLGISLPIAVLMATIPEALIRATAGSEFLEGADALRIMSGYVLLLFIYRPFWGLMWASGRDSPLLGLAIVTLVVNIGLNVVLVPTYGFVAAAAISVGTQAFLVGALIVVTYRIHRFVPSMRYLRVLLPAAAVMAAIALGLPGPELLAGAVGLIVYAGLVVVLPGPIRDAAAHVAAGLGLAMPRGEA